MLALLWPILSTPQAPTVEVVRVPGEGLQPRAGVDEQGTLHLVSFHGEPDGGRLEYRRSSDGARTFSAARAVHSDSARALALGSVRGAALALGRGGRVHVAWNGLGRAHGAPLWYARTNEAGEFEPERDLAGEHEGLDGGSAVAADARGNVWLVWHASDGEKGEAGRRVFVRHSSDDGASFSAPRRVDPELGVCPCCGLAAAARAEGGLAILYRSAHDGEQRDTTLLLAHEPDGPFRARRLDRWRASACVMSTFALAPGPDGLCGAFESEGAVRFLDLERERALPAAPPGVSISRKHPSLACAADGTRLLAWTEDTAYGRGGSVAWQLFSRTGQALDGARGHVEGLPVWGLVQAVALPDRFVVLY